MPRISEHARTQVELAGVLGMNPRTLRDWIDNQGLECFERGLGYHVPTAIQWAVKNRWSSKQSGNPEGLDRMEDAELRCKVADAAIKEAKAEQLVGALVDRETVEAEIGRMANRLLVRLAKVPGELAEVVPPEWRAGIALDSADRLAMIRREIETFAESTPWATRPASEGDQQQPWETESEVTIETN